jgi:hypothetical protein
MTFRKFILAIVFFTLSVTASYYTIIKLLHERILSQDIGALSAIVLGMGIMYVTHRVFLSSSTR